MPPENNKNEIIKFFIIIAVSLVIAIGVYNSFSSDKNTSNNFSNTPQQLPQATQHKSLTKQPFKKGVSTTSLNTSSAILGSSAMSVQQSVLDFLAVDYPSGVVPFQRNYFSEAIQAYEKKNYTAALQGLEKNRFSKDPVTAILIENCKVMLSQDPVIKFAIATPLTGELKEMGIKELLGTALFQEEVNRSGGMGGKKVWIQMADDKGDKAQAVNTPNAVCALTFDSFLTIQKALEATQTFSRDGVLQGMNEVNFVGATGRIKFDGNGDVPNKPLVMLQIANGQFTPLR